MQYKCAIVIPLYKPALYEFEILSLRQLNSVIHERDIIFCVPESLNPCVATDIFKSYKKRPEVLFFDKSFFETTAAYNKLLLSSVFYRRFVKYDFILIYQTDAWIFRDDIKTWTDRNFDYVGAPWVDWIHASRQAKNKNLLSRIKWRLGYRRFDAVGNGGLSLRRVKSMIAATEALEDSPIKYEKNEDFYFAFEAHKRGVKLKIPTVKDALKFAFDENPELAMKMAGALPMGCHGWPKYKNFWLPIFTNSSAVEVDNEKLSRD